MLCDLLGLLPNPDIVLAARILGAHPGLGPNLEALSSQATSCSASLRAQICMEELPG